MDSLLSQYIASMNALQDRSFKSLSQISAISQTERANVTRVFTDEVRRAKSEVLNIHNMVTQALQIYKDEVQKWGEIRRESGRYEKLMLNASALLAAKNPNAIKKLPPSSSSPS